MTTTLGNISHNIVQNAGRLAQEYAQQLPQEIPTLPRQKLLTEALQITSHDRNSAYGNPEDNFQNIADRWNLFLKARFGQQLLSQTSFELTPEDVGLMMIDMKLARLSTNPSHRDSLVDIAGYAACAEDCRVAASAK